MKSFWIFLELLLKFIVVAVFFLAASILMYLSSVFGAKKV